MTRIHTLGYPRLGARRELKRALERYWSGDGDEAELLATGRGLRATHWREQAEAGLDYVAVGDFSWYDHVLDTAAMVGAVPPRFGDAAAGVSLDGYFRMARGRSRAGTDDDVAPCEMTKWFDTNYHYLVPELARDQVFALQDIPVFRRVEEARALGLQPKPVLVGPLTLLWLARCDGEAFDRLALLERLLPVYRQALERLARHAVWVQVDEPILALDLPPAWREAFAPAYEALAGTGPRLLLANYFDGLGDNLETAVALPVDGLHVDLVRAAHELEALTERWPAQRVLSAGVVDGRNVWRTDLDAVLAHLAPAFSRWGERLWIAPSCSLLHCPLDLEAETQLDAGIKRWLAFARQKLSELATLATALDRGNAAVKGELEASRCAIAARDASERVVDPGVRKRLAALTPAMSQRSKPYAQRAHAQHRRLKLPTLPTTTIGSFPQTADIRAVRREFRAGRLTRQDYEARMRTEIEHAIRRQEALGLDVLVHGEPERNDMVEYFGERLTGFAFTRHGWVQSYGSRAVKPPILYGDVSRAEPMTVDWFRYAQSLTERPVKGMLTGPVTVLKWSFVRDDQPLADTARQLALALRDEVADLEAAGARIIQVDEPALREGLPLKRSQWAAYLRWAVEAFRLTTGGADEATQIHTHMCYADFNDIIESIAALDADVISIESSRSGMALLRAFEHFEYPNEIGPGVYDIHSPRVPGTQSMERLLRRALASVPAQRLWVNPDCGLKTRDWPEVEAALSHMVSAAQRVRATL